MLFEGRQIYFGPASDALAYFDRLGFERPQGQTVPDFLTSMTAANERRIKPGFENSTPRTSEDFSRCWKDSREYQHLLRQIEEYNQTYPLEGDTHKSFSQSRDLEKSRSQRKKSPYTLSYLKQIQLCLWRDVRRLKNDPSVPIAMITINFFEALIISSVFYNLGSTTSALYSRGAILFMVVSLISRIFTRIANY